MKKTTAKIFVLLTIFIALATSSYADTAAFTKEPSAWAPEWDGSSNPYSRNIFWDFSKNPTAHGGGQGSKDAAYYGTNDTAALRADDYVAKTNDVKRKEEAFGLFKNNQDGVAIFNIANLAGTGIKYFWLEMDINIKNTASYISAFLLPTGGSVIDSWGTGDTLTWSGTDTGLAGTVNAWFKIDPFSSAESLVLNFHSEGTGSYAYVDNVHIATTPEPISAALFITGAVVMALRRRRNLRMAAI